MSANQSNWREPEYSTWSFQNMDKVLNTAGVKKGLKTTDLDPNPAQLDDLKTHTSTGKTFDLSSALTATYTDGFIVLKDGKIVYEYYGRSNTKDSKHIIMSMTKSITGLLAGILSDQGKLDVAALITKYVPEVEGTPYEHITVRQCLDMRTGFVHDDATPAYRQAVGWVQTPAGEKVIDLHEFLSSLRAEPAVRIDGLEGDVAFDYVSVNTDLMGWILERASGQKFADLLSELIWQPMGAESDAYITTDHSGNARAAGGLCATLRDIARVAQLVLHDGDGIVPKDWIQDILNNGSRPAFAAGPWEKRFSGAFGSVAYRSYWVANREDELLIGLGIHGQLMIVDRKNGIVMAKTSSQPDRFDIPKVGLTIRMFKELQKQLKGGEKEGTV